jgi:hypothetical protein
MRGRRPAIYGSVVLSTALALGTPGAAAARGVPGNRPVARLPAVAAPAMRALPSPLYGVTVDSVANPGAITASALAMTHMPITRVYFDVREPASYYAAALRQLQPDSYLMGELLDSSDSRRIGTAAYNKRVRSYLALLGSSVDLWEIGNEVNGNWTGRYRTVEAKLTSAFGDVAASGKRSALTLYYNVGCGDGPSELDPVAFSQKYVPATVRNGLDYVLLSYYEDSCNGIRPSAATWSAYFARLHSLYPHALLGFGEVGMANPATSATLATAQSLMHYYYGLAVNLPYYVGGYFWWYYYQDCLPFTTKPLWSYLQAAFTSEAAALGH